MRRPWSAWVTTSLFVPCVLFSQVDNEPEDDEDEIIELSPFEVSTDSNVGYLATQTLAGTRIRTDLRDVGSAISVVTQEMLNDVGATDNSTLLQYTPNAEVAGTRGTYAGLGSGTSVDESGSLRSPGGAQRVRGLAAADNTRDFFRTDIPWDSYITSRVDIQRGPNALLFGLGSPAGIVNAALDSADFRDFGEVTLRVGSYGSARASVDFNREIIEDVLAVRVEGLWDHEKFRQDPTFENDERIYAAIRFDPQLFEDRSFRTSIRANYENGKIDANRPRIIPPYDSVTPWFRSHSGSTWTVNDGMGKTPVTNLYDADRNDYANFPTGVPFASSYGVTRDDAANPNYQPWIGGLGEQQQPFLIIDGSTGEMVTGMAGYINNGSRNPDGSTRGAADSILGRRYAPQFLAVGSYDSFARNADLPLALTGQYRSKSLTDPSVFDFYNELIDGQNKSEWSEWEAYNFSLSQTAFNDRLGVELAYDKQIFERGGYSYLLWTPTLNIDIMRNGQDFYTTNSDGISDISNPNYGRPFVSTTSGGRGSSYESELESMRASVFAEFRVSDVIENDFLVKLLGRHRFNGVYSTEDYFAENRSWYGHAHDQAWAAYSFSNDGLSNAFYERAPISVIYLGDSLADRDTASGANIPRANQVINVPSSTTVRVFDSTWVNNDVVYGDAWAGPSGTLGIVYGTDAPQWAAGKGPAGWSEGDDYYWTQASNPANYMGWTNHPLNLIQNNERGDNELLLASAGKTLREVRSQVLSWQGFFWDEAIVGTFGWRNDEVTTYADNALPNPALRNFLDLSPGSYALQDLGTQEDESITWGVVVHANELLGEWDPLPVNLSLSYNSSENFQVTSARVNVYGQTIGNPAGETEDYGIVISSKDNKYTFRAIKYETRITNATSSMSDPSGIARMIAEGFRWRNVFLYDLSAYDWSGRESPSYRNTWTNPYPIAGFDDMTPAQQEAALAASQAEEDAAIRGWNEIQSWLTDKGFFDAWGFQPVPLQYLTDRSTYEATVDPETRNPASQYLPPSETLSVYSAVTPQGYSVTSDTVSKGYEFEFTANPIPAWRITLNASKTEATETNVGGAELIELFDYMQSKLFDGAGNPSPAGLVSRWGGAGNAFHYYFNSVYANFVQLKLREGTSSPEIRKWRWNLITNYTFQEGFLKGLGVGGSYRWQDKVAIGYPVVETDTGFAFDVDNPYYGPTEDAVDLWASYSHKINKDIDWKIQINVRNAFADDGLIPISTQPDGSWASVRIKPTQEWFITNTFTF